MTKRQAIQDFLLALSKKRNSKTHFNPYRNAQLSKNLEYYLNAVINKKGERVLLVGEAPGYKGCRLTGIPFSSGKIFDTFEHPLLKQLKPFLTIDVIDAENTATIVWEYLTQVNKTPLFWNSYPFHPYPEGKPNANRAPNAKEIRLGEKFLKQLAKIYQPHVIAGVGAKGTLCAERAFPDKKIYSLRHPSFGGKRDFVKGMNQIYQLS